MSQIQFSKVEKEVLVSKIERYFRDELDQDIGQFDAEFLLDFISKEMGAFYYNRGLADAQAVLSERMGSISDAIYQLEKPTDL